MREQEAIKWVVARMRTGPTKDEVWQAGDTAIKAMEKQIPQQPVYKESTDKLEDGYYACPKCGSTVGVFDFQDNYCSECGQAIEWEKNNG